MKNIFFIALFFCCNCSAQMIGVEVKPTLNQRFGHGNRYLYATAAWETTSMGEQTMLPDSGKVKIYYTVNNNNVFYICLATADTLGGIITKRGIVVGNGVVTARQANCSFIVKSAGTYYLYAVDGYGAGHTYLYTSTNGYTFTDQGIIFNKSLIPVQGYGNIGLVRDTSGAPVQIGGKYQAFIEATSGSGWQEYLLESTSLNGTWSYVRTLTGLQVGTGSYSRASVTYLNGTYYCFYHYSELSSGAIPTYLAYATSTDAITWLQKEVPMKALESLPFGISTPPYITGTSQIADCNVLQMGNKTYLMADYVENSNPTKGDMYLWTYNGTFLSLITNTLTCIGCAGVYP